MNPSNCKHESHQRRSAAASLPPHSGGSLPFRYPQGGNHSLNPISPYPFPFEPFPLRFTLFFIHLKKTVHRIS